jgi:hypothetical protein
MFARSIPGVFEFDATEVLSLIHYNLDIHDTLYEKSKAKNNGAGAPCTVDEMMEVCKEFRPAGMLFSASGGALKPRSQFDGRILPRSLNMQYITSQNRVSNYCGTNTCGKWLFLICNLVKVPMQGMKYVLSGDGGMVENVEWSRNCQFVPQWQMVTSTRKSLTLEERWKNDVSVAGYEEYNDWVSPVYYVGWAVTDEKTDQVTGGMPSIGKKETCTDMMVLRAWQGIDANLHFTGRT